MVNLYLLNFSTIVKIVNTLYQMVIDGTYLSIFKPMINRGGEIITSDVIVPGAVTTFSDPNADLQAINVGSDLKAGLETLAVEIVEVHRQKVLKNPYSKVKPMVVPRLRLKYPALNRTPTPFSDCSCK